MPANPTLSAAAPLAAAPTCEGQRLPRMVLHVLNGAGGGAALSTLDLISQFERHGVQSCAVCDTAGSPAEVEALRRAVQGRLVMQQLYWSNCKRLPLWKRPLSELRQLWHTRGLVRSTAAVVAAAQRWQAELIHTNTLVTPEGGRAAARLGLPHIWHVREQVGPDKHAHFWGEGPRFGRYLARRATKIIANSQTAARTIAAWLPPGLLEVIPNGIDLTRFSAAPRPERRPVVVGMVGNLTSPAKKHGLLIEAAAMVPAELPIEWRIYGHDPRQTGGACSAYVAGLYEAVQRSGLQDRLRLMGHVSNPAQIMSELDLLVHPSDRESFGRIFVEAMAAGLPAIGTRAGGAAEIIDDGVTGLLVPPDDAAALAAAIGRLARDAALRRQYGAAGRQRAEQHYSIEQCARSVLRVYAAALSRPLAA